MCLCNLARYKSALTASERTQVRTEFFSLSLKSCIQRLSDSKYWLQQTDRQKWKVAKQFLCFMPRVFPQYFFYLSFSLSLPLSFFASASMQVVVVVVHRFYEMSKLNSSLWLHHFQLSLPLAIAVYTEIEQEEGDKKEEVYYHFYYYYTTATLLQVMAFFLARNSHIIGERTKLAQSSYILVRSL